MEAHETIIGHDELVTNGGKMDVVTIRTPNGLGPPNPTKKFGPPFGSMLSLKNVLTIVRSAPPPQVGRDKFVNLSNHPII